MVSVLTRNSLCMFRGESLFVKTTKPFLRSSTWSPFVIRTSSVFSRAMSTVVTEFAPPANLNDLTASQKTLWSEKIDRMFEDGKEGYTKDGKGNSILNNAPRPQFFNPRTTERAADLTELTISWVGFPRIIKRNSPTETVRWKKADESRHVQDEYCEWSVSREGNRIVRVDFTCEGPEYWEFLGEVNPRKVVELYKQFISDEVQEADLFFLNGKYNPENRWNSSTNGKGAMHLIQRNNSLSAEVELAAGASMVREVMGRILTDQQELIGCGKYGQPERNSDPHIGALVNELARKGGIVALKDPVGLYFDEFNPDGWETPDGSNPKDYWKIVRGSNETPVRAIYEVPASKGFTVGDIKINGKPIQYGGQIADYVRVKLVGIAQNFDEKNISTFGCVSIGESTLSKAFKITTGSEHRRFTRSTRTSN